MDGSLRAIDMALVLEAFDVAWQKCAFKGLCDEIGGAEYLRCWQTFQRMMNDPDGRAQLAATALVAIIYKLANG